MREQALCPGYTLGYSFSGGNYSLNAFLWFVGPFGIWQISSVSQLSETPDYFMVSSIKLPAFPNGGIKGSIDLKMVTYTGSSRETSHLKKNYHSTRYREVFVCLPDHCPLFSPWFCILGGTSSKCFLTVLLLKRPVQWEALPGDLPAGAPLINAVLR